MKRTSSALLFPLAILGLVAIGCSATPTPAPSPSPTALQPLLVATATLPPSPPPALPATQSPTSTSLPTATLEPTSAQPSLTPPPPPTLTLAPTLAPPANTLVPSAAPPQVTAAPSQPPTPEGSIAYRWTDLGINRASIFNFRPNNITPLVVIGYSMDLELGTNAHIGEWSPDNSQFAYVYTRLLDWPQILRVLDFKTGNLTPLYTSESGGGLSSPTWSPDGKRVAFIEMLKKDKGWAIKVVNADGTGLTEIRASPQGEQYRGGVSWSKQNVLAFAQNLNGPSHILKMNPDGGGAVDLSTGPTADDSAPVWSPDGEQIAFTSNRDGLAQIYVMNADGSGVRRVSHDDAANLSPSWSPDGNWIAFTSLRNNAVDVYIMDLHGDNVTRVTTTGGDHPMWSR